MFIGIGTLTNVVTVVVGALIGLFVGHKIPERTRELITSTLGLVTGVMAIQMAAALNSDSLTRVVGHGSLLVVLGALLLGGILGSWLQLERRLEASVDWFRARFTKDGDTGTFVDAVVTPTLLFCIGPLAILGSLSDGLGRGSDQLMVKSALDGFAAIAFASTLGVGVVFSAIFVGLFEGGLTLLGYLAGDFLPLAHIDALTATGGVLLLGVSLRLLKIKQIPVGDLMPSLLFAPIIVQLVSLLH